MAETPVSADAFVRVVLRSMGGREGVKGLFEARVDGGLRVPVEGTSGQARVYAASELLALPGPVDVGVAECDVWQAELDVVVVQVSLARELGDTVGGDGVLRVVLGGGQYLLLTVHCSARGGEDHLLHTVLGTVL